MMWALLNAAGLVLCLIVTVGTGLEARDLHKQGIHRHATTNLSLSLFTLAAALNALSNLIEAFSR